MYHFFVDESQITNEFIDINDSDVNHIVNVLRLVSGDELVLCDRKGNDYKCSIDTLTKDVIRCKINTVSKSKSELPVYITLFQGVPKQDKMELIVQKNVELGVSEITPVYMSRCIVKYDDKKVDKKIERWQSIVESAAKQSKRGIIPKVNKFHSWKALLTVLTEYDMVIVPYECESGMEGTRRILKSIIKGNRIAVVIGPEGGFDEIEITELLALGGQTISLGNRILRTETAGFASLAMMSYQLEED